MNKLIFASMILLANIAQAYEWPIQKNNDQWYIYNSDHVSSWYLNADGFTVNLDGVLQIKSGECSVSTTSVLREFDVRASIECTGQTFTVHLRRYSKEDYYKTSKPVNPKDLPDGSAVYATMVYDRPYSPQQPVTVSHNCYLSNYEEWSERYQECVCIKGYSRSSNTGRCMKEASDRY